MLRGSGKPAPSLGKRRFGASKDIDPAKSQMIERIQDSAKRRMAAPKEQNPFTMSKSDKDAADKRDFSADKDPSNSYTTVNPVTGKKSASRPGLSPKSPAVQKVNSPTGNVSRKSFPHKHTPGMTMTSPGSPEVGTPKGGKSPNEVNKDLMSTMEMYRTKDKGRKYN